MNCEEFSKKVSAYVEDRLPFGERIGMWLHGVICPACRRYQNQIEWIADIAKETRGAEEVEPECPKSVKSDLMGEYRQKYCDDAEATAEPASTQNTGNSD